MATIREGLEQEKLGNPGGTAKYSTFPIHKVHATTEIFGLITPFEFRNILTGDEHHIGNSEQTDTYTLAAPLMSQVWKNKAWFWVPRMAILPNAWEKIYTQPTIGEDIDATIAGTSISSGEWSKFLDLLYTWLTGAITDVEQATPTAEAAGAKTTIEALEALMKTMIINEYIYSWGSLLNRSGCKMAALWESYNGTHKNFDSAFDAFIKSISYGFRVTWDGSHGSELQYTVRTGATRSKLLNELSIREFLTKARDNLNFEILTIFLSSSDNNGYSKTDTLTEAQATTLTTEKTKWVTATKNEAPSIKYTYSHPVDLARLWAYQLCCAEFMTDDQIDYVYNAEIYRQYIGDLVQQMITDGDDSLEDFTYTLNGIKTQYDWLSAKGFSYIYLAYTERNIIEYDYITALFNLNRSLKFKDYFTGSKTIPIAPGDNNVTVNNDKFDVLDLAETSLMAKFRYAIKRIGRKINEYTKGLLGVEQAVDYHYPLWIGSTKTILRAEMTENTGAAQMDDTIPISTTAQLKGYSGDYRFTGRFDRDSIVIGFAWYDVERLYYKGTDRSFMAVDRFDHFNQYMQFAGDQPLYSEEYDTALTDSASTYFGYKPAYEEHKEAISTADAGFVTSLPGYAFLNDMEKNGGNPPGGRSNEHVSPDFIRSKPTELDRFYKSLTGYSLATYFHFICLYREDDNAKRSMVHNPGLNI